MRELVFQSSESFEQYKNFTVRNLIISKCIISLYLKLINNIQNYTVTVCIVSFGYFIKVGRKQYLLIKNYSSVYLC